MENKQPYFADQSKKKTPVPAILLGAVLVFGAGVLCGWMMNGTPDATDTLPTAEETSVVVQETAAPEVTPQPVETPAPTPEMDVNRRLLPAVADEDWDHSAPVEQTIDFEFLNTDFRMAALPKLGKVARSYFGTVTFVGDSITSGLGIYTASGIPEAKYCAYIGAGPEIVANNSTANNAVTKVPEAALDALAATQPDYVYLMFGTNTLVGQNNEERFIAYYELAIDRVREVLPGAQIYIQAIPGVQEDVVNRKPGLSNERIRTVNDLVANMALRKGCYFINTQEALSYPDGSMIDDYDANYDGIHMSPSGYAAWTDYLMTHTAWNRRTLYQERNPYYIYGA